MSQTTTVLEQVGIWVLVGLAGMTGGAIRRRETVKKTGEPFWTRDTFWELMVAIAMGVFAYGLSHLLELPEIVRTVAASAGGYLGPKAVFHGIFKKITGEEPTP